MPYRRLPNTDAARLKALRAAYSKGREIPPFKLAYSQSTFQRALSFLPSFEKAIFESKQAFSNQVKRNKDFHKVEKKAKLYISHFIQVVNMAILRGDLLEQERDFFGIQKNIRRLPVLNTDSDIIKWGEKLLHGEDIRKTKNLSPITNPTIAVVKVRYENFLDSYKHQKILQKSYQRALEHLASLRAEADKIIIDIWNEVEESFKKLPDVEKRKRSEEYGVVYVFRKTELS